MNFFIKENVPEVKIVENRFEMSECLTLDVFATEETFPDEQSVTTKVIVQSILNETLHSAISNSDKDENTQPEEKPKEYKVIQEQILADNELRIQNGKIHLQANVTEKIPTNHTNSSKKSNIKIGNCSTEINEITNSVNGKTYKTAEFLKENDHINQSGKEKGHSETLKDMYEIGTQEATLSERPFTPFTAEDLRQSALQVWKNGNSSALKNCDGDLINQPQEVFRLMEELSSVGEITNSKSAPTVLTIEENIAKIIKDMKKRNINISTQNVEEASVLYDPDERDEYENACVQPPLGICDSNAESIIENRLNLSCNSDVEENFNKPGWFSNSLKLRGTASATDSADLKPEKFNDNIDLNPRGSIIPNESVDSFMESSESVIQIIDPQESSDEESEEGKGITFSIIREGDLTNYYKFEEGSCQQWKNGSINPESIDGFEEKQYINIHSGMTTVGPMKNLNYNPKALAGPEVDFGKMIRISSSQEMKTESGKSFSSAQKKIYIGDNEDNKIIFSENGYMESDTIIHCDIASLTKLRKVKEALSDRPKSDENLDEEEKLMRSPLDLKDVDADSSNSYNVIDLNLPLASMEETNSDACKQFENLPIIINGSNYQVPREPLKIESQEVLTETVGKLSNSYSNVGEKNLIPNNSQSAVGKITEKNRQSNDNNKEEGICDRSAIEKNSQKELLSGQIDEHPPVSTSFNHNKSMTQPSAGHNQKHNISRVFQKASNKFIIKDSDSFLRNSKSLPRDASKLSNTESFKSLLDDCQTSAASVLKKSRSLLRNTQNIFKAVSKTGFNHVVSGDKQIFTSDIIVARTDSRQSLPSKKNEFSKLKDALKSKVDKTLKSLENIASPDIREMTNDRKELKPMKENETEERIDQTENTKKPPPKSPLVCTNQFFQNQSIEVKKVNCDGSVTKLERWLTCKDGLPKTVQILDQAPENSESLPHSVTPSHIDNRGISEVKVSDKEIAVLYGVKFPDKCRFGGSKPQENMKQNDMSENFNHTNRIVLEKIHAVCEPPISTITQALQDETPNSIFEKLTQMHKDNPEFFKTHEETLLKNSTDILKTFTFSTDCAIQDGTFDKFISGEGKDLQNSLSNVKLKRKNKKLSSRIRRFWQSAFGKVKTSQKKDVP